MAFFDVDGTLWTERSVVSFYRALLEERHGLPEGAARFERFLADAAVKTAVGEGRETLNAWFYETCFRDLEVALAAKVAGSWYEARARQPGFFLEAVVRRAEEHVAVGDAVVLVSGSFREVVAPLAERIGAAHLLIAPLEERGGVYTGRLVGKPMIGEGKADAVRRFLEEHRFRSERCYGYGDDDTDVPFLACVGTPTIVSPLGAPLSTYARSRGWSVLDPSGGNL
ncbi:MAG TPA: HAD-IB family hydrolase [Polyangiaceae bacterium]|jgi:HAD superfamily hydrolase (TIGR01490 family)